MAWCWEPRELGSTGKSIARGGSSTAGARGRTSSTGASTTSILRTKVERNRASHNVNVKHHFGMGKQFFDAC